MRVQRLIGTATFLQLYAAVLALPTNQQPLSVNIPPNVQTVQAAYVSDLDFHSNSDPKQT